MAALTIRRGAAVLGTVALMAGGVTGCGSETGAVCGVVVDSTTYAEPAASRADVTSKLPEFARGCDWIGFAAVTGASEGSSCREDPVAIAATREENPNDNPVVEERVREHKIKQVVPKAVRLFDCPAEGEGSDVLGALRYVVKQMTARRQPDREHRLIVFSDLSNNRGELNINQLDLAEEARRRKAEELRKSGLLPDMSGYAVTVHGFLRERTANPDRFPLLEAFWSEAFQAAGATSADLL